MSSFFKQLFPFMKVKKKKEFSYIIKDVDPNSVWEIVGELGDGSFGKVYKVNRTQIPIILRLLLKSIFTFVVRVCDTTRFCLVLVEESELFSVVYTPDW